MKRLAHSVCCRLAVNRPGLSLARSAGSLHPRNTGRHRSISIPEARTFRHPRNCILTAWLIHRRLCYQHPPKPDPTRSATRKRAITTLGSSVARSSRLRLLSSVSLGLCTWSRLDSSAKVDNDVPSDVDQVLGCHQNRRFSTGKRSVVSARSSCLLGHSSGNSDHRCSTMIEPLLLRTEIISSNPESEPPRFR